MSTAGKINKDYQNIAISNVKLVASGLKGCKVTYEKIEKSGEHEYYTPYVQSPKFPVHKELETNFTWLKGHLLSICGYDAIANENLMEQIEITGVSVRLNGFVISGKLDVFGNGKTLTLNTPFTTCEEEYHQYEDVLKIITGIWEEVKVYLSKTAVMQDIEIVVKANKGNVSFDEASFRLMPEKEQKRMASEILKKLGSIVIHEEELKEMDDVAESISMAGKEMKHEEEVDLELKEKEEVEAIVLAENPLLDIVPMEVAVKELPAVEEKGSEDILSEITNTTDVVDLWEAANDDEDFGIPISKTPEPKKSTAKKLEVKA